MSNDSNSEDDRGDSFERFAAGVAHELNNFVGVILGNVHLVSRMVGKDHDAARFVEEIRKAAEHHRAFAHQLGLLGPQEPQKTNPIDLTVLVERVAGAVQDGPQIELSLEAPLDVTDFDFSYFENALAGWIAFAKETPNLTTCRVSGKAASGFIALRLEDDGPVARDELSQLFEPFVRLTDRPRTGLRLALLANFASRLGGSARAFPSELGGIGIELSLPTGDAAIASSHEVADTAAHIYVAVGDVRVARLVSYALEREGFRIVDDATGAQFVVTDDPTQANGHTLVLLPSDTIGDGLATPFTAQELVDAVRRRVG